MTCIFIRSLLNSSDLPSYISKLSKRYTIRLLCCWCVQKCWGKGFSGRHWEEVCRTFGRGFSSKAVSEVLGMKYGFTNRGCLHCPILKTLHGFQKKRAHKSRDMQFFVQNVQNETFEIFKMLKNNMKFTRAACWVNSKLSHRDKNTTFTIFLFFHYCWSLLWCIYCVELSPSKKTVLFAYHEKCFLFHLKSCTPSQDI